MNNSLWVFVFYAMAGEPAGSPVLEPVLTLTLTLGTGLPATYKFFASPLIAFTNHLTYLTLARLQMSWILLCTPLKQISEAELVTSECHWWVVNNCELLWLGISLLAVIDTIQLYTLYNRRLLYTYCIFTVRYSYILTCSLANAPDSSVVVLIRKEVFWPCSHKAITDGTL